MSSKLPIVWTDKVNSPELLAFLEQYGPELYVTAEEINLVRDAVNELYLNSLVSEISVSNGFSLTDQIITFAANWIWVIKGTSYTNPSLVALTIPFAASGKERIDIIVVDVNNTFTRISGIESIVNPVAPETPSNTILVTFLNVSDGVIGDPAPPLVGDIYIKKTEKGFTSIGGNGDLAFLHELVAISELSNLMINGGIGVVKGIFIAPEAKNYQGKIYSITNKQANNIVLLHDNATTSVPFYFSNAQDYTCKPNEVVTFRFNAWGKFEMVSSSMPSSGPVSWDTLTGKPTTFAPSAHGHAIADVTGLATELANKVDKVTGKGLSAEDYSTVEKNKLAALPASAEPAIPAGTTAQYYRGDKTFQTLDKSAVGLANVDNTSDASKPVSAAQAAAIATREPIITSSVVGSFWSGLKTWVDFATTVRASVLTGLSTATTTVATATDTLLVAIGKLQGQISNKALAADVFTGTDVLKIPTAKAVSDAVFVPERTSAVTTAGQINDLARTNLNSLSFTTAVSAVSLSGLATPTGGTEVTIINATSFVMTLQNQNALSLAANRLFNLGATDVPLPIGGIAVYKYDNLLSLWRMVSCTGLDYLITLKGATKRAVSVNGSGFLVADEILDAKIWDLVKTTAHTKATLNSTYPLAVPGVQVICPNITPNGQVYEKYDNTTNEWFSFSTTKIV